MPPLMPLPAGDEQNGNNPHSYEQTLKVRLAELRDLVHGMPHHMHKMHNGKKISMTVPQKADLSLLEMLSGYKYQQLINWKQDGKEDDGL